MPTTLITLLTLLPLSLVQAITYTVTATSTIPPTTITLAAASSASASLSPDYTFLEQFQFQILNSTNYYRYLHPAPYLQYNASLADFAQSYSEKCKWSHNPVLGKVGYGENLAKGYGTPAEAVDAWGNEASMFDFDSSSYTGFSEETGHFTQLVWRGSHSVGCGWTDCDGKNGNDGVLVVCNYFPAGNVMASDDSGDEYMFFKQNVVQERRGGREGFDADEAGRGIGGPSVTAMESVAGTATASAGAVALRVSGQRPTGTLGCVAVVLAGVLVGAGVL